MEELKEICDISQEDRERVGEYIKQVEEIRAKSFEAILDNVFCPSPSPNIKSLQEFEEMHVKHCQKLKTNVMKRFQDMQDSLKPGDQLWTFRRPRWMRSYAHVVIITEKETFVHVAAPALNLKIRSIAKICRGRFADLSKEELCFVVRPDVPEGRLPMIFSQRAEVCLGITMDYVAASSNCETFANGVLGKWTDGCQVSFN